MGSAAGSWLVRVLVWVVVVAWSGAAWASDEKPCNKEPKAEEYATCTYEADEAGKAPPKDTSCKGLDGKLDGIESKSLDDKAEILRTLRRCSQSCQVAERACSAASAPKGANGEMSDPAKQSLGFMYEARARREKADRLLVQARNELRIEAARCRYQRARDTVPSCHLPKDLDDLVGRPSTLDAASRLAATDQLKAVGAGQVPAPVAELLSITTEIAIKKAKRNGLELLETRLELTVCGIVLDPLARKAKPVFPETCRLLGDVSLEDLAADPRRIQPALIADLMAFAIDYLTTGTLLPAAPTDTRTPRVAATLRLALETVARVRRQQNARPSHADAQALLGDLLRLRCDSIGACEAWDAGQLAIPLALETLVEFVAREGKTDVATIVGDLHGENIDPEIRRRAIELSLLGLHALGLAREPAPGDEHDTWYAAVSLVFEIANTTIVGGSGGDEAARQAGEEQLERLRKLVDAIADENTAAAISAGSELLVSLVGDCKKPRTSSDIAPSELVKTLDRLDAKSSECNRDRCKHARQLERATHLLGGVASYAATYTSAAQAGKTDAELRASRKEGLEGMIDAATRRTHRHGDWVLSLGIPVGFTTGGQWLRRGGFENGQGMPPQISVPLGFGIQRLVGKHYVDGEVSWRDRRAERRGLDPADRIRGDGWHIFVSLIDLGQFAAYEQDGTINAPRWGTLLSPGLQLGKAFGTPSNMLVVGPELRYAPMLLPENEDDPGGALRFGLAITYYVSLYDFN